MFRQELQIFVFAHPDDELAIIPIIRRRAETVINKFCYMTNGSSKSDLSQIKLREQESIRFLLRLGAKQSDIHFIGKDLSIPDGELSTFLEDAYREIESRIRPWLVESDLVRIVSPAWEGGHHDHDSSYVLALRLSKKFKVNFFQFSLYNQFKRQPPFFRTNFPLPHPTNFFIRVKFLDFIHLLLGFATFRSQLATWLVLSPFFVASYLTGRLRIQRFVLQSFARPHDGPLLYETRFKVSWHRLRERFEKFSDRLDG